MKIRKVSVIAILLAGVIGGALAPTAANAAETTPTTISSPIYDGLIPPAHTASHIDGMCPASNPYVVNLQIKSDRVDLVGKGVQVSDAPFVHVAYGLVRYHTTTSDKQDVFLVTGYEEGSATNWGLQDQQVTISLVCTSDKNAAHKLDTRGI